MKKRTHQNHHHFFFNRKQFFFIFAIALVFGFAGWQLKAHAEIPIDNDTAAALETDATGHAAELTPEILAKEGYVKVEKKESQEEQKPANDSK